MFLIKDVSGKSRDVVALIMFLSYVPIMGLEAAASQRGEKKICLCVMWSSIIETLWKRSSCGGGKKWIILIQAGAGDEEEENFPPPPLKM